jgi:hypothetical protein
MSGDTRIPLKMKEAVSDKAELDEYKQWCEEEGVALNPLLDVETVFSKQRADFVRPHSYRYESPLYRSLVLYDAHAEPS